MLLIIDGHELEIPCNKEEFNHLYHKCKYFSSQTCSIQECRYFKVGD